MKTALITGASRGIGLGFTKHLLAHGYMVVAAARNPEVEALQSLQGDNPERFLPVQLDLERAEEFPAMAAMLQNKGIVLDLLIHNAGIFAAGEEGLLTLERQRMLSVLDVNVIGPLLLTKALLPLLRQPGAIVAALTSGVGMPGKVKRPVFGGQYSYGISKAALYLALTQLDGDLHPLGITTIGIGPGFVRTDMTKGADVAPPLSVDESVTGMLKVLENVTLADSGRFYRHDGSSEYTW